MPEMKLPEIQEGERLCVFKDETDGMNACHDAAEGTCSAGVRDGGFRWHGDASSGKSG